MTKNKVFSVVWTCNNISLSILNFLQTHLKLQCSVRNDGLWSCLILGLRIIVCTSPFVFAFAEMPPGFSYFCYSNILKNLNYESTLFAFFVLKSDTVQYILYMLCVPWKCNKVQSFLIKETPWNCRICKIFQ